jgi:hypothetical protein
MVVAIPHPNHEFGLCLRDDERRYGGRWYPIVILESTESAVPNGKIINASAWSLNIEKSTKTMDDDSDQLLNTAIYIMTEHLFCI